MTNITDQLLAELDAMSDHPKLKLDERESIQAAALALRKARTALAPSPAAQSAEPLHAPDTPAEAAFDELYLSLCCRPITIHETARRCWKAGYRAAQAAR